MKVTVDWLKKYIDFPYDPVTLGQKLTMLGLELEGIEKNHYDFSGVVVGKIVETKKHEKRPNISICQVDIGGETVQLVCGAPNAAADKMVAVALPGAKLPSGQTIKEIEIDGYKSPGMICSEAELGISHQSEIIMELSNGAPLGTDLRDYLGETETVLELSITPNRPDCLGVIGVAREVAALVKKRVRTPEIKINESNALKVNDFVKVEIKNPKSCPRYTARYIEGIKIGPSPRWLIQKLEAVGIRTINNIVDVTNFVMMETGQPLHAFDYDELSGGKIVVRHATAGEKFVTLDEKEHTLSNERLLICDAEKPVALAGVMGGLNSEISTGTTRVLLESALFDPTNIRRTAKTLEISTESSRRFERGVDPEGVVYALNRAAQLIQELAGGKVAAGFVDEYPRKITPVKIELRIARVNSILGAELSEKEITDLLERLEFSVEQIEDGKLLVHVPTFRVDVEREIDLIEEISRLYGFNNIEESVYAKIPLDIPVNKEEKFQQLLRDLIVRLGYNEILTHAMISFDVASRFTANEPIKIKNPLSEDMGTLRTSLLAGLLQIVKWNKNRKITDQQLFEIGNIFYYKKGNKKEHREKKKIALVRTGKVRHDSWLERGREVTFFDLKGDLRALLKTLNIDNVSFREKTENSFLDNERSVNIYLGKEKVGFVGFISDEILELFNLDDTIVAAEIDFQPLFENYNWARKAISVSKFPAVHRDIAVVVEQMIVAETIESHIWESGGKYLRRVELFDVYSGKQVAADKKSFAFSLSFQSDERTLTEAEVDADFQNILETLKKKDNAHLRA
ncbi:MAG: phenylalanine--tRNA ligase subunit beta [Calditrichaeota bacterium]|nr:phenylalanine--tRNA ligase subunit beta [Calditrichota bacterium]